MSPRAFRLHMWWYATFSLFHLQGFSSPSLHSKRSRKSRIKSGSTKEFFIFRSFSHSHPTLCMAQIALSPFLAWPECEKLLHAARFRLSYTGTLSTQATPVPHPTSALNLPESICTPWWSLRGSVKVVKVL